MSDALRGLNPGIAPWVRWLRSHRFDTRDSGDGVTHDYECDRDYPYVSMVVRPSALSVTADRLRGLLIDAGMPVSEAGHALPGSAEIHASYDPCNGIAIVDLQWPAGFGDVRCPKDER